MLNLDTRFGPTFTRNDEIDQAFLLEDFKLEFRELEFREIEERFVVAELNTCTVQTFVRFICNCIQSFLHEGGTKVSPE